MTTSSALICSVGLQRNPEFRPLGHSESKVLLARSHPYGVVSVAAHSRWLDDDYVEAITDVPLGPSTLLGLRHEFLLPMQRGSTDVSYDDLDTPDALATLVVPARPHELAGVVERLSPLEETAFEIVIVIDDVETQELDRQRAAHPSVRMITTGARLGPSAARNLGASMSSRELLCFIDADMFPDRDAVRALCRLLNTSPFGAVFPRILPAGPGTGTVPFATGFPLDLGPRPGVIGTPSLPFAPAATFAVRRQLFRAIGGFDPHYRLGEDVDFVLRLRDAGAIVAYLPWITCTHLPVTHARSALRRSLTYGLSYLPLARAHPDTLSVHRGRLGPWLIDGIVAIGGGIPAIALLAADAYLHLRALRAFGESPTHFRRALLGRRAISVASASLDHLLSNQLLPLLVGALLHRRTRRFVLTLIGLDLLRARLAGEPLVAIWRRVLHRLGYSAGLWLSRLLR
ncbi:MAG: glycosyltransferase [Acidimicrobiales bacterium]